MQTIEADLQLIMRTFLGLRIAENYEHDDRTFLQFLNFYNLTWFLVTNMTLKKKI